MPTKRPRGGYTEESPISQKYNRLGSYNDEPEIRKYYQPQQRSKMYSGSSSVAHLNGMGGGLPASYLSNSPVGKKKHHHQSNNLQRDYSKERLESMNNYLY